MVEIREVRICVGSYGLQELKFTGAFFTWCNKQNRDIRVYNRIDRVLVNSDWNTMLPASEVHFMNEGLFDHGVTPGCDRKLAKECILKKQIIYQYLQQKSKIKWLQEGDQNTKFYHNFLKARRNANRIFTIKDKQGKFLTNTKEINKEFIDYYNELLGKAHEEWKHANSGIIKRGLVVTEEQ
ncbi:hypothetical protein R3W88_019174 [Solanum pinnatisectum]|uniref:Uncharacterized protein n=1 Tax=Solanum pinnatisectum TaxID=50273 RepID=A0AAV9KJL0_9SOLN|nr:hypothetical protein R3W88_019174 [Solanum pinnatisectum]